MGFVNTNIGILGGFFLNINKRIIETLKDKHLSQKDLCTSIDVSTSTLNNWLKSNRRIPAEMIIPISEFLGVDLYWLLSGISNTSKIAIKGADFAFTNSYERDVLKNFREMTGAQQEGLFAVSKILLGNINGGALPTGEPFIDTTSNIRTFGKTKKSASYIEDTPTMKSMKIYDQPASAGAGNQLYDTDTSYEVVEVDEDTVPVRTEFGVRISGDSMKPIINDGDVVWVEPMPTINDGEIGVFVLNGESLCKKLEIDYEDERPRLISRNPTYAPIEISEHDELIVIGKVLSKAIFF